MESNKQALAGAYSRKLKTVHSPTHTPHLKHLHMASSLAAFITTKD